MWCCGGCGGSGDGIGAAVCGGGGDGVVQVVVVDVASTAEVAHIVTGAAEGSASLLILILIIVMCCRSRFVHIK